MMYHELEITIDAKGEVTLTVHGVKGAACVPIASAFIGSLGCAVNTVRDTPEMRASGQSVGAQEWAEV